ncbi:MAG TPA: GNAT family N-acetyltransferase [Micromonosporaceae bacterium]|nr:GNAT family N-acetyltransferase [Micromonosporaceae bacterium]
MSRRLVNLTLDTLEDIPRPCRDCVYWELDPVSAQRACATGDPGLEKEAWVSQTLLEWGSCGKLIYVDSMPAGFAMFAPPAYVPRSMAFPTSPVSPDAALLMTAHVVGAFAGGGLGRMLIQGVARDMTKRGIRAIEAFGDARGGDSRNGDARGDARGGEQRGGERGREQRGERRQRGDERGRDPRGDGEMTETRRDVEVGLGQSGRCLAPADFFLAVGFKTVRQHPKYPRLRLELRTALSWKSDVEYALEKLLGSMNPESILRPVRPATRSTQRVAVSRI